MVEAAEVWEDAVLRRVLTDMHSWVVHPSRVSPPGAFPLGRARPLVAKSCEPEG